MRTKDWDILLKTLEFGVVVAELYILYPPLAIAAAVIAIYCLLNEAKNNEEEKLILVT